MTIKDIIRNGHGRAGSNGAWYVCRGRGGSCELVHYSTTMLRWDPADPTNEAVLDFDTGHGSVSDQAGMNTAFRVLGLPYYYSRRGGAEIRPIARQPVARCARTFAACAAKPAAPTLVHAGPKPPAPADPMAGASFDTVSYFESECAIWSRLTNEIRALPEVVA